MKHFYPIMLLCVFLLTGCWSNPFIDWSDHSNDMSKHPALGFITQYHTINNNIIIHKRNDIPHLTIDFSTFRDNLDTCVADHFKDKEYNQIKAKYGDTKEYWEWCDPNDIAYSESITSIEIITNNYWDSTHPAGSNINDLFDVKYATYKYYVDSGFDDSIFEGYNREVWEERCVAELKRDDMWFIHTSFQLICKHPHEGNEIHPISVTLELDTGRKQTYNLKVNYHI